MIIQKMKMTHLNATYWSARYQQNAIGWDLGKISNPIKSYVDQLTNKNQKILIPGAGNSYEAEYLWNLGFQNIYVIDIASQPLINFKKRVLDFPDEQLILGNFFDLDTTFDLIIEQTFFCALDPQLRTAYAKKCDDLLHSNGKITGVLFNFPLTDSGPPFGGNKDEYQTLFEQYFKINTLETCYNSEPSRENKELFFIFDKTK